MTQATFAQLATKKAILRKEKLHIDEWEGDFELRQLSGLEHEEMRKSFAKEFGENWSQTGGIRIGVQILARTLSDIEGNNPTVDWLMAQPMALLNRLSKAAMALNGMTAQAIADMEKN